MMQHDWGDALFRRVYDQMQTMLWTRRRNGESAESIRQQLEWEYVASGVNWVGKGEVWHVTQEATIAAYEAFLADWEAEPQKGIGMDC